MVSSDKPEFKKYLERTVNYIYNIITKEYLWCLYKAENIFDTKTLAETWFNLKSSSDGLDQFIFHRQRGWNLSRMKYCLCCLLFPLEKKRSLDQFTLKLCKNGHQNSKTVPSTGRSKSIQFLYSIWYQHIYTVTSAAVSWSSHAGALSARLYFL